MKFTPKLKYHGNICSWKCLPDLAQVAVWVGTAKTTTSWWRHQMETFSALLAICVGNSAVTGEFPAQGPVTRTFDVFFDLHLNTQLSKQSWGWWFETLSRPIWRHCNAAGNNPWRPNDVWTVEENSLSKPCGQLTSKYRFIHKFEFRNTEKNNERQIWFGTHMKAMHAVCSPNAGNAPFVSERLNHEKWWRQIYICRAAPVNFWLMSEKSRPIGLVYVSIY